MAMPVSLSLLGRFELRIDGATIGLDQFERRSGADLIQLLALADGRRLHREQVMEALWPGSKANSAANSLRKAATFARRATGASDAIVVRDQVVALFPDRTVEVDVDVVETARVDDEASVTAAIEAYRGELAPDVPYAEWVGQTREALRQRMIDLLAATRRWDDLVRLDPSNEEATVALMDRALGLGDRQSVLRRYDDLEIRLRDELGVTPGPAALALRDRAEALGGPTGGAMSGMRTFLMADVEASAQGWQTEAEAGVMAEAVQRCGGTVFDHDHDKKALCAVFGSASEAVAAAVAIQRAVHSAEWVGDRPQVRVGLDVGEAEYRDGDWHGAVLTRSARILESANGDQIVCSELVASLAAPKLASGITTVDLGLFRLPGSAPTVLHRVDPDGIERRTGLRASRLSGQSLGPARDLLIGRDGELREVLQLLATERLVTIIGPGGAGKTHLARHVGGSLVEDFPGGVWICRFSTLSDARGVDQELLSAIGAVQHPNASVVESVVRSLGDRRALVVLDNCEHLLDPIAALSREILDRCSGTTLLATSREPLGLGAEQQYRLGELDAQAAVALFVATAKRQGTALEPNDELMARICGRLDNLPLAVQLAAARTRTLDLVTIESLLDDRFAHLASSTIDRPEHHQTLRTAIAWSFDSLSPELQQLLCDLSVLTGRFTLAEATAVTVGERASSAAIVGRLDDLVRRSLVVGPERVAGETVYRLLESIRLFAQDQGDRGPAEDRHLAYFRDAAEASRRTYQDDSLAALEWFRSRWGDLRQAQAHAARLGRLDDLCRIVNASSQFCRDAMQLEVVEWCEHGLESAPETIRGPEHVEALANWSLLATHRGQIDLAGALAERAFAVAPESPDVLRAKALIAWGEGDAATALNWVGQILESAVDEPSLEAGILTFKAVLLSGTGGDIASISRRLEALAVGRGPVFEAHNLFVRSLEVAWTDPLLAAERLDECQFLTDRHDLLDMGGGARLVRGWVLPHIVETPTENLEVLGRSLEWLQERGLWSYAFVQLGISARAFAQVDRLDLAVTILSACVANGLTASFQTEVTDALLKEAKAADADSFDSWWQAGQRLDASAACSLALSGIGQLPRVSRSAH